MSDQPVTFVNVLAVDPARQPELLDVLQAGVDEVIRHRPGFRSQRLLAALDGSHVVSIAEWSDAAAVKATQADPAAADHARRAAAIGTPAPGVYRLVSERAAR